jgi:hypothetical protein
MKLDSHHKQFHPMFSEARVHLSSDKMSLIIAIIIVVVVIEAFFTFIILWFLLFHLLWFRATCV